MVKKTLVLFSALAVSACSLDIFGIFATAADVDTRFRESRAAVQPSGLAIGTNYFSFVVIADTHVYSWANGNFTRLKTKLDTNDRFVLACGDLTQEGGLEYMTAYRGLMDSLGLPYYSTPGNHDTYFGGWNNYRDILGPSSYTFTAGNCRVIVFDSASGTLGWDQRKWLEGVLAGNSEPLCVVMTHFQLFSPSLGETQQYTDIEEVHYLIDLFGRYGVDYVFMGHSHKYQDNTVKGVRYIVCEDFKEGADWFVRVTIDGNTISHNLFPLGD